MMKSRTHSRCVAFWRVTNVRTRVTLIAARTRARCLPGRTVASSSLKKTFDIAWGDGINGECIASCSDGLDPDLLPEAPSDPTRLVVYATSWAQYRVPGTSNLPDGSTVVRPDSCATRATKPADALASTTPSRFWTQYRTP